MICMRVLASLSSPVHLVSAAGALGCLGLLLAWHGHVLRRRHRIEKRIQDELRSQVEACQVVEGTLHRTLAMFQLLQDVTAAAGIANSLEEALKNSMDIICGYTGWPVAHAFLPGAGDEGPYQLVPAGIWHLDNPHDFEAFLRTGERKGLGFGKGLPGRAWSSRSVTWASFTDQPDSTFIFRRALDVGLVIGFAIPVFRGDALLAVLEFFSTPTPLPDRTVLDALAGVGEQLGRVAERLQAQADLTSLNQRLLDLNDEKNQFLSIASHDLKSPLNSIALCAELMLTGELDPEEIANQASRISVEARNTAKLIQKLLDVTAIESGRFNLRFAEASLANALLQVQAKYQGRAEAKGQTIKLDFGGGDTLVWADHEYLQEVIDNLVSNALKFMDPGPPVHSVTLSLSQSEDMGILQIRDQGPGFSDEDQTKAFGRFAKLSARPTGGESSSGLGLAIVRKLVESMQGKVVLESQIGRGATFRIILPLAPAGESPRL